MRMLQTVLWQGPLGDGVWGGLVAVVIPLDPLRQRVVVAASFRQGQAADIEVHAGGLIDFVQLGRMLPWWVLPQGQDLTFTAVVPAAYTAVAFSFSLGTDEP